MKIKETNSKRKRNKPKIKEELKEEKKEKQEIKERVEQDFFEEPVRKIPPSSEISTPTLERAVEREIPNPVIETTREREHDRTEDKRIDYSPISSNPNYFVPIKQGEEKKYDIGFVPPVLTRKQESANSGGNQIVKSVDEISANQENNRELIREDFIEEKTRLPFQDEQKKYKRFKLR